MIVNGPALVLALVERDAADAATQLRDIVNHSSEAIFLVDVRDPAHLRYEGFNRCAEEGTGRASALVRGRTPHEVFPKAQADQLVVNYRQCLEAGRTTSYDETLTMGGATRTWRTTLVPIRDEEGYVRRLAGFARDQTEALQQETTRAALEAQVRQAQKMEAIGRLAGGLAHDFNNIVTAIIGHGELLAEQLPPGRPERASVDAVREAGHRASALVRQVLTFARRREQPARRIQLHAVVEEVMRLARARVPTTIDITGSSGPPRAPGTGRRHTDSPGHDQHHQQRLARHASRRRRADRLARHQRGRPGVRADARPAGGWPGCLPYGQRHRPRDGRRHSRARIRAVFHHQATRRGHRSGACRS